MCAPAEMDQKDMRNHQMVKVSMSLSDRLGSKLTKLEMFLKCAALCIFFIKNEFIYSTVFENHRKSLIQHCEQSELRLHFEWTKVLPDRAVLIGQKLPKSAKIKKFRWDSFKYFLNNVLLCKQKCAENAERLEMIDKTCLSVSTY